MLHTSRYYSRWVCISQCIQPSPHQLLQIKRRRSASANISSTKRQVQKIADTLHFFTANSRAGNRPAYVYSFFYAEYLFIQSVCRFLTIRIPKIRSCLIDFNCFIYILLFIITLSLILHLCKSCRSMPSLHQDHNLRYAAFPKAVQSPHLSLHSAVLSQE